MSEKARREGAGDAGISFEQIRHEEIRREIRNRRTHEGLDAEAVKENLVGLTLSGGGIRSGAIGLGIFQGLDRSGILRYIDYLSTVSGGGYAGAYLSSFAVKESLENGPAEAPSDAAGQSGDRAAVRKYRLPITPDDSGRQPERVLEFLDTGRRLNKPLIFANRYLIGLLLNWIVIFSGLVVVAAGAAWLFRQIYNPRVLDYLSLLGFRDDFGVCLFPPLMVFILWAISWGFSYLPGLNERAAGNVARVLFIALIVVSGVSFAALIGAGDIDAKNWMPTTISTGNSHVNSWMGVVQTMVLSAILAGLLPYLNPFRLFRSGAAPSSWWERYTFAISSRALVFGVPFLVMAYFVQEDISRWYANRDGLIYGGEISDWGAFDPAQEDSVKVANLWSAKDDEVKARPAADAAPPDQQPLNVGPLVGDENRVLQYESLKDLFFARRRAQLTIDQFHTEYDHHLPANLDEVTRRREQEALDKNGEEATSYSLVTKRAVYPWTRWGYCLGDMAHGLSRNVRQSDHSDLDQFVSASRFVRAANTELLRRINEKLIGPEFATEFLPDSLWQPADLIQTSVSPVSLDGDPALPIEGLANQRQFVDKDARDAWLLQLRAARDQAILVGTYQRGNQEDEQKVPITSGDRDALPAGNVEATRTSRVAHTFSKNSKDQVIADANRRLLEAYYGPALTPRTTVLSSVVWQHDQATRRQWFLWALAAFAVSSLFVDLNATSCHRYYAKQTAEGWIEDVPGMGRDIPMSHLNTTDSKFPYHLICGCVRLVGRQRNRRSIWQRSPFLFSKQYCGGGDRLAYARTDHFMNGGYLLPDAIAASGGAISPTESNNPLVGVLLTLMNFRLGQWVENPAFRPKYPALWRVLRKWPFVPARWLLGMLRTAENRPYCLVTDGGYYENLGVEALLLRRCKLVIAVDSGQDEHHQFEDFIRLVRRARMEHGIRLQPLDEKLEREILDCISLPAGDEEQVKGQPSAKDKEKCSPPPAWTQNHYTPVRVVYPDGTIGLMIYMKASLTGDEPLELIRYQTSRRAFPHDNTGDQFFDADQFLSYLQLGCHMAEKLASRFEGLDLDTVGVEDLAARFKTPVVDTPQGAAEAPSEAHTSGEAGAADVQTVRTAKGPAPGASHPASAAANKEHWTKSVWEAAVKEAIEANNSAQIAFLVAQRIGVDDDYVLPVIKESLDRTSELPTSERWAELRGAIGRSIPSLD